MGPVESDNASSDFNVFIACLIFGFVVFVLFKFVFGKNKKDQYQASNSYRPSATNQKQHHSEINTRTDRIIIKGHKFGVDESNSIMEAIKNGNRVEAIWLIRTQPGISLKDAKFFVDKTEKNLAASPRQIVTHTIEKPFVLNENKAKKDKDKSFVAKSNKVEISKAQFSTFIAALESDNKIAGIKVLREVSNISFKDAKDFIDHVLEKGHINEITKEDVDSAINKILKQMNGENVVVVKEVLPKSLPNKLSKSESESINNALENGNKIDAVRLFSDATGLGWNESNDYVQKLDEKRKEKLISNNFESS